MIGRENVIPLQFIQLWSVLCTKNKSSFPMFHPRKMSVIVSMSAVPRVGTENTGGVFGLYLVFASLEQRTRA